MKAGKTIALTLALCLIFTVSGWAASSINWTSLKAAQDSAKNGDKMLYLHFYTDWCGYCKKMNKETFKNPKIIDYLNKNFLVVKVNPEKDKTAKTLGQKYGVRGFPAHGFSEDGVKPLTSIPGYMPPQRFLKLLEFVKTETYKTMSFQKFEKTKK